jgi:hypothetical protein
VCCASAQFEARRSGSAEQIAHARVVVVGVQVGGEALGHGGIAGGVEAVDDSAAWWQRRDRAS